MIWRLCIPVLLQNGIWKTTLVFYPLKYSQIQIILTVGFARMATDGKLAQIQGQAAADVHTVQEILFGAALMI